MPPNLNKWTCLEQVGARFGLGRAQSFLCVLRLSLAWSPSSLEPGHVQTRRVQGLGQGLARGLLFFRWCLGGMPPILNKWTRLGQAGASLGCLIQNFLFLQDRALAGGRQGLSHGGLFTRGSGFRFDLARGFSESTLESLVPISLGSCRRSLSLKEKVRIVVRGEGGPWEA